MRYSAIIKFFAVILCAAVIVTAVGSGVGLLALTECGLFNRSFEDFYNEDMGYKVQSAADGVAARYASQSLGGASQVLTGELLGYTGSINALFDSMRYGYVLKDETGAVVQTDELPSQYPVRQTFTADIGTRYIKVLKTEPVEEPEPVPSEPADILIHTMPSGDTEVSHVTLEFADGSLEEHALPENGYLEVTGEGNLRLTAEHLNSPGLNGEKRLEFITLLDGERRVVYEVYGANGLMLGYTRRDGMITMLLPGNPYESVPEDPAALSGSTITNGDFTAYDAIPEGGADVSEIHFSYGTPGEGASSGEGSSGEHLGRLSRDEVGNPRFETQQLGLLSIPADMVITSVSFLNENRELLYEASCPSGISMEIVTENGSQLYYFSTPGLTPGETAPTVTESVTGTALRGVVLRDTDVYSMPSLSGKTEIWLKAGTEVTVLQQESIGDAGWVRIDLGWISMADLVLEQAPEPAVEAAEPAPREAPIQAVAKENIDFHRMPDEAEPVGVVKKGDIITLLQIENYNGTDWGLTDSGWVQMEHLTIVTAVPVAAEVPPVTAPAIVGVQVSLDAGEETAAEETAAEEAAAEETEPEAASAETLPTAFAEDSPEEDPLAGYDPDQIETHTYYEPNTEQTVKAYYIMEPLQGYTLELQLAAGADRSELLWLLLGIVYSLRNYLLIILGGSLALLGLCVVYICCASAHKRGSDIIRAGALNRLPLDGYMVLVGCLLAGFVLLGYEGSDYFMRNGLQLYSLSILGGSAYLCSLLLVGFFFAFVAQLKTPGGFWWRNSLCGRCVLLAVRLCRKTVVFCGSQGSSLVVRLAKGLWKLCMVLWLFGKRMVLKLWDIGRRLLLWVWDLWGRCFRWTRGNLARLFGLLPITWQFLTTGFVLVCFLYVMIRTYKVGYILLGFGLFFAVILYAASAFAILLESAKRMSKGDLDTQVDDRMLIGGFREFAHRLNDLAGVAVIAAQKQLKSERMKTELITNVSHDIKTPLTSIINYVDLLQKPHTEAQQDQYLEVLDRQSQRLKKLIDDLMEMSKASTGNLSVDIARMDAGETVNQALGEFADKLDRAQLMPVFRQPDDPVYMMADGRLVWRVMSNLLGNAVKYALPGTRIYLDLMEMDGKVVISMKNISREELNVNADELMERFVRGDASRNTEGSGLGLNITQSLMEVQRGQLQILVDGDLFKVTLIFPGA